jgi:hypothetical protein
MRSFNLAVLLLGITACAAGTHSGILPPEPSANPENTSLAVIDPSTSTWTFQTDREPHRYQLTNTTTFKLQADSAQLEQKATTSIIFSLAIDSNDPSGRISGEISQLSIQPRPTERSPDNILPIAFSAWRNDHRLQIQVQRARPTTIPCADSITTHIRPLISQLSAIPRTIQREAHWRDSVVALGCQGTIPLEVQIVYNYHVIGETQLSNHRVILIQRSDSIHTSGEGSQDQHRIGIESTGTGQTQLFLDVTTGRLLNSSSQFSTNILTQSSGREVRFSQQSKETVRSIP